MTNITKEAAHQYNFVSPADYLKKERESEGKNEYYDGLVLAMSGASLKHNIIDRNLVSILHNFLKGKECQVLPSHMRVSNPSRENYLYPDASIVCDKPVMEDDVFDTLTNPSVIFEILSPSTKGSDKRRKFFFYMQIPSLKEYIMIDSERRYIIAGRKQADDSWKFEELVDTAYALLIETIHLSVPLTELYEGTEL